MNENIYLLQEEKQEEKQEKKKEEEDIKENKEELVNFYENIIIGSGISGLMTLKHLKELNINNVIILEKNKHPFGIWNIKNHPSVINETHCVSSKLYMSISDFPMKKEIPEFPHHSDILKYYYDYANHFQLLDKIKYDEYIIKTYKTNYKDKSLWKIETKKNIYYTTNLIIASGTVNKNLNIPTDLHYKKFSGKIYHADEFKKIRNELINKKILLVGVSETSCDLAIILKNNNKISISSRKGVWMQNRTLGANSPADMLYNRYSQQCIRILGEKLYQKTFFIPFYDLSLKMWGNYGHGIPEWTPKDTYLNSIWNKNRDIINFISKGEITPQGNIINIQGKKVYFENEKEEEFDIIIFGTGYKPFGGLDFLEEKYYSHLYKHIFSLEDSNLYFIGFIRPFVTGIPMIAELQSRWIAQEIKNKNSGLPDKKKMFNIILKDINIQKKKFPYYTKNVTMNTIINPYNYCNEIAKNINAIPNLWKYIFTDWALYIKLEFHSWNHHAYRLNDSNLEKRQIALDNINYYSKNDSSKYIKKMSMYSIFLSSIFYLFIILIIILLFKIPNYLHNLLFKIPINVYKLN